MRVTGDLDRFLRYVVKGGECWRWIGACTPKGYGVFWLQRRYARAHRAAWELLRGPIPAGMLVCHVCDTPPCVNPEHLFLGTPADNMADKAKKGRARGAPPGDLHFNAKLSTEDVREIRAANDNGVAQTDLAREYGVHAQTIFGIVRRRHWRHVT